MTENGGAVESLRELLLLLTTVLLNWLVTYGSVDLRTRTGFTKHLVRSLTSEKAERLRCEQAKSSGWRAAEPVLA